MFFRSSDISLKNISVYNLQWKKVNRKSYPRPFHAISYRIKGNAEFIFDNGCIHVNAGDILFVPQGFKYTLRATDEELFVIHFSSDSALPDTIKKITPENKMYFERKFSDLYYLWTKKQFCYEYECKSAVYRILSHIEREAAQLKAKSHTEKISEAIDFIHENFTNSNISVSHLADLCGMSDTYFRRIFVEQFRTTPLKYINQLKLKYATELLQSGYYTVQEVSDKCGFTNVSYFSMFIKKQTNRSPSDLL